MKRKVWLLSLLGVVLFFVAAYQGFQAFLPLQFAHLKSSIELGANGVHSRPFGELMAYERDHCKAGGPCDCVALVHGMGDSALTWKRILLEPAKDWENPVRLIAMDLPGTGGSPMPLKRSDYRSRQQGKLLAAAIDREPGCDRWLVAGNSFGGWVAAWTALELPKKVNRLLLVDAVGLKGQAKSGRSLFQEATVEALKEFQRRAYFHPRELPDRIWKAAAERMRSGTTIDVMQAQVDEDFLDTQLAPLKTPTIVLWGSADRITTTDEGKQLAQKIGGAEFRVARDCGHLPQKECPAIVVRSINDLLRRGAF